MKINKGGETDADMESGELRNGSDAPEYHTAVTFNERTYQSIVRYYNNQQHRYDRTATVLVTYLWTPPNTIRKDISLNVLGNFTDRLLKNAVRSSEYITSSGCLLSGTRIVKYVAGNDRDLIEGTIPNFARRGWVKPWKPSNSTVSPAIFKPGTSLIHVRRLLHRPPCFVTFGRFRLQTPHRPHTLCHQSQYAHTIFYITRALHVLYIKTGQQRHKTNGLYWSITIQYETRHKIYSVVTLYYISS